jgi:hypothetical protein
LITGQTPSLEVTVLELLQSGRYSLNNEKETQAQVGARLRDTLEGVLVESEKRLSARDIPDFLVDGKIAIEVKLRGWQKKEIFKQLTRYAKHDVVECIILVTNVSLGLPTEIEGKPVYYVSMGRAWL